MRQYVRKLKPAKNAGSRRRTIPSGWAVSNIDQPGTHCQRRLDANSKNRRLPPAVHARRKEERKNEKLNLSNYIVPFKF